MEHTFPYSYEINSDTEKICPLTRESPTGTTVSCYQHDCSSVCSDTVYYMEGIPYRCAKEQSEIQSQLKRKREKERLFRAYCEGLNHARLLDPVKFWESCKIIDQTMLKNRMNCDNKATVPMFLSEDECMLVYFLDNGNVQAIKLTENPGSCIGTMVKKLSEYAHSEISYYVINKELSTEINLVLHILHRLDASRICTNDNALLVKEKFISGYLDANYGIRWHQFDKLRKKHLEITEYNLCGSTYYLKKELDDIIRLEYSNNI